MIVQDIKELPEKEKEIDKQCRWDYDDEPDDVIIPLYQELLDKAEYFVDNGADAIYKGYNRLKVGPCFSNLYDMSIKYSTPLTASDEEIKNTWKEIFMYFGQWVVVDYDGTYGETVNRFGVILPQPKDFANPQVIRTLKLMFEAEKDLKEVADETDVNIKLLLPVNGKYNLCDAFTEEDFYDNECFQRPRFQLPEIISMELE